MTQSSPLFTNAFGEVLLLGGEWFDLLARVLLQALLNSLWQGALVVALVWTALRLIGRESAATRHALWLIALGTVCLLPVFAALQSWASFHPDEASSPAPLLAQLPLSTTIPTTISLTSAQTDDGDCPVAVATTGSFTLPRTRTNTPATGTVPVASRPNNPPTPATQTALPAPATQVTTPMAPASTVPATMPSDTRKLTTETPTATPTLEHALVSAALQIVRHVLPGLSTSVELDAPGEQWAASLTLTSLSRAVTQARLFQLLERAQTQIAGRWQRASRWLLGGSLPSWLIGGWLALVALGLGQLLRSYWAMQRLVRSLQTAQPATQASVTRMVKQLKLRRRVRVLVATETARVPVTFGPMTFGWRKPVIVLSAELAQRLSAAECDSVLAHELAHIKRWDYVTNWVQRVAQCALFFHPAVWLISRQLVVERELACDDWAVKLTGEPRRYATCLTKLIEFFGTQRTLATAPGVLFGGFRFGKHIITRRVEMILNRNRNAATAVSKPALVSALSLASLLVFLTSTLLPAIAVPRCVTQCKYDPQGCDTNTNTSNARTLLATGTANTATLVDGNSPTESAAATTDGLPSDWLAIDAAAPEVQTAHTFAELGEAANETVAAAERLAENAQNAENTQNNDQWWQDAPAGPSAPPAVAPVAQVAPVPPVSPVASVASSLASAGFAPARGQNNPASVAAAASAPQEKKEPIIPEAELLKLFVETAKRDSDPNVRAEALAGIARLQSEAAVNALLELYDATNDPKMKAEIVSRLVRRNGDNKRVLAKLMQIAKTEKDEAILSRVYTQLAYIKGDEGATQLIQLFDSTSEQKLRLRIVRSLSHNKSKKAVDKLMQIAKSDADAQLRQAALRSLAFLDNNYAFNFDANFPLHELYEMPHAITGTINSTISREVQERIRETQQRAREQVERNLERNREQLQREQENKARHLRELQQQRQNDEKAREKKNDEQACVAPQLLITLGAGELPVALVEPLNTR